MVENETRTQEELEIFLTILWDLFGFDAWSWRGNMRSWQGDRIQKLLLSLKKINKEKVSIISLYSATDSFLEKPVMIRTIDPFLGCLRRMDNYYYLCQVSE